MKIPNLPENKNKVQIRRIQIPIKLPFMQVGRIAFEIWIFYKSFHSNKDSVLYVSNTAGRELCVRSIKDSLVSGLNTTGREFCAFKMVKTACYAL